MLNITKAEMLTYLIDVCGYSIDDFKDYTFSELIKLIHEMGRLKNFQAYTK